MKSFLTGLLLSGCAAMVQAHPAGLPADTSRKETPVIRVDNPPMPVVVLQKANVVFPDNLLGHEEESLSYIEKFSEKRREYLLNMYKQGKKFFPKVLKIFQQYDVPAEFRVLLALESGYNAHAVSSAGAVGYWQIMDEVAREYGMKIAMKERKKKMIVQVRGKKGRKSKTVTMMATARPARQSDDRTNFLKSTQVAAKYLRARARNLDNDWLLIAASYNCGVGNVWNAMERSGKKNPTFWDIRNLLPAETRAYVMNFITLNVIFHNMDQFSKNNLVFRDVICLDDSNEYCPEEITEDFSAGNFD